ncbi:MAG: response regulator [Planctomycetes bacterium]|nr:response regulator [Planctomycetota bacterium]
MSNPHHAKIMVVDDEQTTREISAVMLGANGYQVCTFDNCVDALQRLVEDPYDAVLINLHMSGMQKYEFLRAVSDLPLETPPVRLGMADRMMSGAVALHPELGLRQVVWKPFKGSELRRAVKEALLARNTLPET